MVARDHCFLLLVSTDDERVYRVQPPYLAVANMSGDSSERSNIVDMYVLIYRFEFELTQSIFISEGGFHGNEQRHTAVAVWLRCSAEKNSSRRAGPKTDLRRTN